MYCVAVSCLCNNECSLCSCVMCVLCDEHCISCIAISSVLHICFYSILCDLWVPILCTMWLCGAKISSWPQWGKFREVQVVPITAPLPALPFFCWTHRPGPIPEAKPGDLESVPMNLLPGFASLATCLCHLGHVRVLRGEHVSAAWCAHEPGMGMFL